MADGGRGPRDAAGEANADDARLIRRVRWRLALWSGGATLVIIVALGATVLAALNDTLARAGITQLDERVGLVEDFLAVTEEASRLPPLELYFGGPGSGTFAFLAPAGMEPLRPRDVEPPTDPNADGIAAAWERERDVRTESRDGVSWRFLSVVGHQQLDLAGIPDGSRYVIQVVQDRSAEQRAIETLALILLLGGLVTLVLASLVGALYAERALVPIREALAGRRMALQRQREFAADASHELRTPLTIIRSGVEHLRRHPERPLADAAATLDDIDAEAAHLTHLVDDLLLLARADSGALDLVTQPVDLGDIAADAAGALGAPAAAGGVTIRIDPEPAPAIGDPVRLRQLVTILVDNAVKHGGSGSTVEVTVRRGERAVQLTVRDHGPGIRTEDLPRVFDRFWRARGEASEGTGLGLAIAAAIVARHGGRIAAANAPDGGAILTAELPGAGPAPR